MEIKDRADACVEEQRYLDAAEHLDDLKAVAPYTPFEAETAEFVEEVTENADLGGAGRTRRRRGAAEGSNQPRCS